MAEELRPNLADCRTVAQLALALGVDAPLLELISGESRSTYYLVHRIPKRSTRRRGEFRVVYEPATDELTHFHRTLARRFALYASQADPTFPADCSNAYIRRRSTKRNALPHCGATLLLKADIKDFFPSISLSRAEGILTRMNLVPELAGLLARVFCLHGTLSPGLSGSPVIANLACHVLDSQLMDLARGFGARYSRYADDISMSGPALPSKAEISAALAAENFALSDSKFRIIKRGQAQFVTGLSISDPQRPHVPKRMKRRLRQELYYAHKFGVVAHLARQDELIHEGLSRLDGTIQYVAYVEGRLSASLLARWESLTARDDLVIPTRPGPERSTILKSVVIDEGVIVAGGARYLALCGALFSDGQRIEQAIQSTLSDYIADPYSAGDKLAIRNEGLHFSSAHPDLVSAFVTKLPTLPFRCYVVLRSLTSDEAYAPTYLGLLQWIAGVVLRRCEAQQLVAFVEQNSRLKPLEIKRVFSTLYTTLASAGLPRPLTEPHVEIATKRKLEVAVPDFMLGVLGRFVQADATDGASRRMQFERLRDRYSLIFNLDTKMAYNRRRPFSPEVLARRT